MCIGQELDHAAATAALDACLLTKKEMAAGEEGWAALTDPLTSVQVQAAQTAAAAAAAAVAAAEAAIAQVETLSIGQPRPHLASTEAREKRTTRRAQGKPRAAELVGAEPKRQKVGKAKA